MSVLIKLIGKEKMMEKEFDTSVSAKDVLAASGIKDMDKVVAVKVNGVPKDLSSKINEDSEIEPIYVNSEEGLEILRHSTAHVMAQAVKRLFPEAKVAIGPAIKDGFYYDFDYKRPFREEDLSKIQEEMHKIIQEDYPFVRKEIPKDEAIKLFESQGETYKVELLKEIPDEKVSIYTQGEFTDLCRGPHIPSTGMIKAFALTHTAGAYWKGDEKNPMLSRIYGTAFPDKKSLQEYLRRIEEAKKRNHIVLGQKLELFSVHEEIGAGLIVWHPNGAMLRYILESFEVEEHLKRGYELVKGPELLKTELWKKSGHFDNYRENMYFTVIDEQSYGIKPMNCLAHMFIYASKIRSYRDLPQRYFELGTVHRHEKSGVLHGLLRVREFTQDDAHIICTPEQLEDEIKGVLNFVRDVMSIFGFEYELELSTRPEKYIGSDQDWEKATNALVSAMEDLGLSYDINEGEGAFYGPKIDVKLEDVLGRKWQCATVQCDFTLPERFNLYYIGKDGEKHRPAMIHRVILGAIERFIGILIEHYNGAFPVWLSPVQAVVMSITDRHISYGKQVLEALTRNKIRAKGDFRNEKLGYKVREAQTKKIPYMLIVGDKEMEDNRVTVRLRSGENIPLMPISAIIERIKKETEERR